MVQSTLNEGIANFYDESSGLWESMWGEHMHHGYYPKGAAPKSNQEAQIDMIEEVLSWAGATSATKVCARVPSSTSSSFAGRHTCLGLLNCLLVPMLPQTPYCGQSISDRTESHVTYMLQGIKRPGVDADGGRGVWDRRQQPAHSAQIWLHSPGHHIESSTGTRRNSPSLRSHFLGFASLYQGFPTGLTHHRATSIRYMSHASLYCALRRMPGASFTKSAA